MRIERLEEFSISEATHAAITQLLKKCFSEYPGNRDYYKQVPSFRFLVWEGPALIGHMGVEHRKIKIGATVAAIFGVSDFCVIDEYQSRKIGSTLLQQLDQLARDHQIDFLLLIANNYELYEKNDFKLVKNTCRWLMINEHQTLGVNHKTIEGCLMVKTITDKEWNSGLMDFLGPIF